jgi:hypothetical protein
MKTKQNWLVMLALGVAAISISYLPASYSWAVTCYRGTNGVDWCRNIITAQGQTVTNNVTIGGLSCTLDIDSTEDDLTAIGVGEVQPPGNMTTGFQLDLLDTACRIAYVCSDGDHLVQYDPTVGTTYSGPFGIMLHGLNGDPCPEFN